jgi:protoheme IX farnesyltransferase
MLPITHGIPFTKLNIVLYSLLTVASSLLPFAIGMSGMFYLVGASLLNIGLMGYAIKLQFAAEGSPMAIKTFHYSLIYLTGLFLVLLLDHHLLIT